MLVIIDTPFLGNFCMSNHHANGEMIDKADVLSLEKGRVPENFSDDGRIFHPWGIAL